MRALGTALLVARRDLARTAGSPVGLVVAVLFLVVQGFSFWSVLQVLADPHRPASADELLRMVFGGTFLYWAVLFAVVAATTMHLVAEERRLGTWEVLHAGPVGTGAVVTGKWLASALFYGLLWLPTAVYPLVIGVLSGGLDPGPVAGAYLGVLVSGAGFLAVGVLASALSSSQVVSCVLAFVSLVSLLLLGMAPSLSPSFLGGETLRAAAGAIDVRAHLDGFARGVLDAGPVVFHAAACVACLVAASAVSAPAATRAARLRGLAGAVLILVAGGLGMAWLARHPLAADLTRERRYTLASSTREVLDELRAGGAVVKVTLVRAEDETARAVLSETAGLLRRFLPHASGLELDTLDPALEPARFAALAEVAGIGPDELVAGGAVVLRSGGRQRVLLVPELADLEPGGEGMRRFRGEPALAAALRELSGGRAPRVCMSTGHGEPPLVGGEGTPAGRDVAVLAAELARQGFAVEPLRVAAGMPPSCSVVLVLGPRVAWPAAELDTLNRWLAGGGRLLVALDGETPSGLEIVLGGMGIRVPAAVVLDPAQELGVPGAWLGSPGGTHPITGPLAGRPTVWLTPRWIDPAGAPDVVVVPLIASSPGGWAEADLGSVRAGTATRGQGDAPGPVPVAVAAERGPARVVVLGSSRALESDVLGRGLGAGGTLVAASVRWLASTAALPETASAAMATAPPAEVRLSLGRAQSRRIFLLCVLILPGSAGLAYGILAWRRRSG